MRHFLIIPGWFVVFEGFIDQEHIIFFQIHSALSIFLLIFVCLLVGREDNFSRVLLFGFFLLILLLFLCHTTYIYSSYVFCVNTRSSQVRNKASSFSSTPLTIVYVRKQTP